MNVTKLVVREASPAAATACSKVPLPGSSLPIIIRLLPVRNSAYQGRVDKPVQLRAQFGTEPSSVRSPCSMLSRSPDYEPDVECCSPLPRMLFRVRSGSKAGLVAHTRKVRPTPNNGLSPRPAASRLRAINGSQKWLAPARLRSAQVSVRRHLY